MSYRVGQPMTDDLATDDGEPLPTYERQAGKHPGVDNVACFEDLHQDVVWRPPNAEEVRRLKRKLASFPHDLDALHVAVIDGYQTDHPGYAGPLAVLVGGDTERAELVPLRITTGDTVAVWDLDGDGDREGDEPAARGKVEGVASEAGRRGYEIRDETGNLVTVWERGDREIRVAGK